MATTIVTGKVRLSYEHIWVAKATIEGGEPKYSASILIPKTDEKTVAAIKEAIKAERNSEWPNKDKRPNNIKNPLKDGDEAVDKNGNPRKECQGHYIINATSKQRPGIINLEKEDILDKSEVYSGCYIRCQISFAPYNLPTSKGVACYLNNIQKLADGKPLGNRKSAKDVFSNDYAPTKEELNDEFGDSNDDADESEQKPRTGKTGKKNNLNF